MAVKLAEQEHADLTVVQLAALLHDVDDIKLSPETYENKDRLDALGAVGIGRAFAYGGSRHRAMHDPGVKPAEHMNGKQYQSHCATTVNHFYEKLFRLKDLMNTETAKRMAEQREAYMKGFLAEFLEEWDGIQ